MRRPLVFVLLFSCVRPIRGTEQHTNLSTANARVESTLNPCANNRVCPPGYGLCVRCEEHGNPQWEWSDAAGAPTAVGAITEAPNCTHFTFDERGHPLQYRPPSGSRVRWTYDAEGRVTQRAEDHVQMCDADWGESRECGPPDGTFDRIVALQWERVGETSRLTVQGSTNFLRVFDARGRLIERVDHGEWQRFVYDGNTNWTHHEQGRSPGVVDLRSEQTFDAQGRLLRRVDVTQRQNPARTNTFEVRYSYDSDGRPLALERVQNGAASNGVAWTHTRSSDGLRIASEERHAPDRVHQYVRTYDREGFVSSVQFGDPTPRITRMFERSARGRVLLERVVHSGTNTPPHVRLDQRCLSQELWDTLLREGAR